MNKQEAMVGIEAMDREQRMRDRVGSTYAIISALPHMLAAGSMGFMPKFNLGMHRGEYGKTKNSDNSPSRAKGMKPFDIDGQTIWAGTIKAARKKARLLNKLKVA